MEELPRFVIADTHLGLEDPGYRPPDADSFIVSAWRRLVQPDDMVWHLGDVALASDSYRRRNRDLLASLPGQVSLIPGNWDDWQVIEMCRTIGWRIRPSASTGGPTWAVSDSVYVQLGEQVLIFSHYPEQPPLSEGLWNLHGHLHRPAQPPYEPSGQHINVAAALHDWGPVELWPLLTQRVAGIAGTTGTPGEPNEEEMGG